MTPVIRIDDEVMDELKKRAVALGLVSDPPPNTTLRRVLGLDAPVMDLKEMRAIAGGIVSKVLEQAAKTKKMKGKWGYWEYNPDNLTLQFSKTIGDDHSEYEVDLEECNTSAEVLDWIFQVKSKYWCSDTDVADLLRAFDDLMDTVQNKLCGGEIDHPFDFKKHLLDKRGKEGI